MLSQVLDRLIAYAARDEATLLAGRAAWEEQAGRVFDDDPLYEERTGAFLEWYTLDRPAPESGRTPAERFLVEERLDDMEGRWVHALGRSHRSLFYLDEIQDGKFHLDDLLSGARFEVSERRKLPGFDVGDIFEARLVPSVVSPPQLLFSRAFQFHPAEAAPAIRKLAAQAREAGRAREETLFLLLRARLKSLRWAHVSPARIYAAPDADTPE